MCVLPETLQLCTLSKNQVLLIENILDGELELNSPVFLDIIPFSTINYDLRISKGPSTQILKQYTNIFNALSQVVCKGLAKEWVKVICPRKQALYPYKLSKKPSWWPKDVPHIEPDHLDKENRVKLLVAILRNSEVNLIDLKRSINNSSFGAKFNSKQNGDLVNRLIYELFYLNLYERLFNGDINYTRFTEKLSKSDRKLLLKSKTIHIRVSCLDDALKNDLANNSVPFNSAIYHILSEETLSKQEALESGNRVKRPIQQTNFIRKRQKTRKPWNLRENVYELEDSSLSHDYEDERDQERDDDDEEQEEEKLIDNFVIKEEVQHEYDLSSRTDTKEDLIATYEQPGLPNEDEFEIKFEFPRSATFEGDLQITSNNYGIDGEPQLTPQDLLQEFSNTDSDGYQEITNNFIEANSLYSEDGVSSTDSPFTPISDMDIKEQEFILTI